MKPAIVLTWETPACSRLSACSNSAFNFPQWGGRERKRVRERNIKLQNMTRVGSFWRGSHWFFFLHFAINLVEKRWLWVLRQLMMWFVAVDHQRAERIAPTLNTRHSDYHRPQHSVARLTVGDPLIISISPGTIFPRLQHCGHTNICIQQDHCQVLWGFGRSSSSSMDGIATLLVVSQSVSLSGPDRNVVTVLWNLGSKRINLWATMRFGIFRFYY